MKNRKISLTITCAAAALAALFAMSSFLALPARAQAPAETIGVSRLSDVENGYDADTGNICYEIEVPAF